MRTFGLIGYPLSHSFSKKFFSDKFEQEKIDGCKYDLFPIEKAELILTLIDENSSLCGINVTIPHKLAVMPFMDELDAAAAEIGAVNCISITSKNNAVFLKGYNTDAYGFAESLKPMLEKQHEKALIFGDGGAAKAVKYVLKQLGIPYLVVVRKKVENTIHYEEVTASLLNEYKILINTTPLGMSPNLESSPPIPYKYPTVANLLCHCHQL